MHAVSDCAGSALAVARAAVLLTSPEAIGTAQAQAVTLKVSHFLRPNSSFQKAVLQIDEGLQAFDAEQGTVHPLFQPKG